MTERVVVVLGRLLDQEDGLGVYALNLLRHLMAQDVSSRYVVLLRTNRHQDAFRDFPNAETSVVAARSKLLWDQFAVPLAARRVGATVLFNPKFSVPFFSSMPSVMVLHASDWYVNPSNYEWWDNLYIRLMMPLYCRKAAALLAISSTIRDDLVRLAGVARKKVTVTYAAPSAHFTPEIASDLSDIVAQRLKLPPRYMFSVVRALHTGHAGRIAYAGGNAESLIAAYRRYRVQGGILPLVIAGDGVREYLNAVGMGDDVLTDVHFLGFVPHDDIVVAYARAAFFVLTTLYESFSLPLVEAMATGTPIVAPTTGACPEIVRDAAILVNPREPEAIASAMLRLERSPRVRERLREAGYERVADFTWARTAERTLEVFADLERRTRVARPDSGRSVSREDLVNGEV